MTPTMTEVDYNSDLLQKHTFSYFDASHKRRSFATPLLCAAVLGCVAGALWVCMKRRGADLIALRGRAYPTHDKSENGYNVLKSVRIELEVTCPSQFLQEFEEEKARVLKHGCPAVGSLKRPISVDVSVVRM
jgi:hypothetical protein